MAWKRVTRVLWWVVEESLLQANHDERNGGLTARRQIGKGWHEAPKRKGRSWEAPLLYMHRQRPASVPPSCGLAFDF